MAMASERSYVRVGNARIHFEVSGSGQPVVLLHGLSGSTRWWRRNVPALAERYRVYVVDMLGFGRSSRQRFVLQESADALREWMALVQEERYNFIGHSMGGLVAAELAARHPECIDRLVLVDAAGLPFGHTILRSLLHLFAAVRYMPLDFLPVLAGDALRAGPRTLLRASWALHQVDISAELQHIAARTLIVWGQHDTLLPVRRGEDLHHALPGSRLHVVKGAGHNPMWDRAAEFNQVVLAFLEEGE